jgi:ubiquinone/menaquinone biosynthesis C-methylase UbiE
VPDKQRYIPALGVDFLTPIYDPFLRWGMREAAFKRRLVQQAALAPGLGVLDLGCGTGTLTIMLKQACRQAAVLGLDGDRRVLAMARRKAAAAAVEIEWSEGLAGALPYRTASFDRVTSRLLLHHLNPHGKECAFGEVFRVLRSGGEVHLVDFAPPHSAYGRLWAPVIRNGEEGASNLDGRLIGLLPAAGFADVGIRRKFTTLFGDLSAYGGRKGL